MQNRFNTSMHFIISTLFLKNFKGIKINYKYNELIFE